jgi:hypothetical protein
MKVSGDRYVVVGSPRQGGMSEVYPGIDTKREKGIAFHGAISDGRNLRQSDETYSVSRVLFRAA